MFGTRALISMCQLLALQQRTELTLLFEKCGVPHRDPDVYLPAQTMQFIRDTLRRAQPAQLLDLAKEVISLGSSYRFNVSPKWLYDQHWRDFEMCLMLDGYLIKGGYQGGYELVTVDPTLAAAAPIEDDLTLELTRSNLPRTVEINRLLENSADDFRKQPPDFNGSLISARVALEAIATDIASERRISYSGNFNPAKWGQAIAYLRTSGLISEREEQGLAGVYSFISEGAHAPVGMTEQEMVRLGRSLAAGMSYFLVKRYLG